MKKNIRYLLLFLSLILYSCSSSFSEKDSSFIDRSAVKYRLIYLIHGDGSYLYYDSTGHELEADKKALEMAQTTAQKQLNSEVIIFRVKPETNFLLFFPRDDREVFHYVNGKLIEHDSYHTDASQTNLELEARYFKQFSANTLTDSIKNFFIYYGHQIPEFNGQGYNASYPEMQFNITNLAKGLEAFSTKSEKFFDLIVLSTCNNGTPGVISALARFSKYIIASPEDLHLSYMNDSAFSTLSNLTANYDPHKFARRFAETAFNSLQASTRTVVSVSLYDTDKVTPFLQRISSKYGKILSAYEKSNRLSTVCEDCKNHRFFDMKDASAGVEVFYRAPEFGRTKSSQTHSGWGCLKTNSL